MQGFFKRHKKYLFFVLAIIALGFISGYLYYHFISSANKESILNTIKDFHNFRYNAILKDLTIMSLLLISSFFFIGLPLGLFYIFYESFSLGFICRIFYRTFKFKGLIYAFSYLIINKLLTFILLIFFIQKCLRIVRYVIGLIIYPKEASIKEKIINNFKSNLYLIVFVFLTNIVLYFASPLIFNKLSFLLK